MWIHPVWELTIVLDITTISHQHFREIHQTKLNLFPFFTVLITETPFREILSYHIYV